MNPERTCERCKRKGVQGFRVLTNVTYRIRVVVCLNEGACEKRQKGHQR